MPKPMTSFAPLIRSYDAAAAAMAAPVPNCLRLRLLTMCILGHHPGHAAISATGRPGMLNSTE